MLIPLTLHCKVLCGRKRGDLNSHLSVMCIWNCSQFCYSSSDPYKLVNLRKLHCNVIKNVCSRERAQKLSSRHCCSGPRQLGFATNRKKNTRKAPHPFEAKCLLKSRKITPISHHSTLFHRWPSFFSSANKIYSIHPSHSHSVIAGKRRDTFL